LEGFKSVSSDQKCIVEAQWGVHGCFLKCPYQFSHVGGLTVRLVTCVDERQGGMSHTLCRKNPEKFFIRTV
ncbi:hypothetical protein, partial [Pseudomonas syringae]|uniref:hypothetical protein n=1 Tax=Pseudomonas syringae TaxID=317 RepID=UPI001F1A8586